MCINKIPPELKHARISLMNTLTNKMERMNFLNKTDTLKEQIFDIYSKNPYPSGTLSNFKRCSFELDGVECASIEGVLQSLKVLIPPMKDNSQLWAERLKLQEQVCSYANNKAKRMGNFLNLFNHDMILNWRGQIFGRTSKEYQRFLKKLFEARFLADKDYQNAIYDTRNFKLIHTIGKHNKAETCLTEQEFIGMIEHLKTKFKIK